MRNGVNGLTAREPSLIKLYMELTGANKASASSVFMLVCCREGEDGALPSERDMDVLRWEAPARDDSLARELRRCQQLIEEGSYRTALRLRGA